MPARRSATAAGELRIARRVVAPQDLLRGTPKRASSPGEVNAAAVGVVAHVAEDVGELERLAEVHGVVAAGRVAVAEDLDAQQADDGRHAVAVELEFGHRCVAA